MIESELATSPYGYPLHRWDPAEAARRETVWIKGHMARKELYQKSMSLRKLDPAKQAAKAIMNTKSAISAMEQAGKASRKFERLDTPRGSVQIDPDTEKKLAQLKSSVSETAVEMTKTKEGGTKL